MKLNELYNIYINDVGLDFCETTVDSINYRFKNRIEQQFDYELEDINYAIIRKYQRELFEKECLSSAYTNIIIGLIKRLIKYAYTRKLLTDFELRDLDLIKDIKDNQIGDKQVIWGVDEFTRFVSVIPEEEKVYSIFFKLLFLCGLRKGEALALKWSDIDFSDGSLTIRASAKKVKGKGQILGLPKTKKSYRTIYLNESFVNELLEYYVEMKSIYYNINGNFIVENHKNHKMVSFSTIDRKFLKYKELAVVKDMQLHGFRHSHASWLITISNDIQAISNRLGHANIEETMNTYLHSGEENQRKLANLIETNLNYLLDNNTFDRLISSIRTTLLKEVAKDAYSPQQLKGIINIYKSVEEVMTTVS